MVLSYSLYIYIYIVYPQSLKQFRVSVRWSFLRKSYSYKNMKSFLIIIAWWHIFNRGDIFSSRNWNEISLTFVELNGCFIYWRMSTDSISAMKKVYERLFSVRCTFYNGDYDLSIFTSFYLVFFILYMNQNQSFHIRFLKCEFIIFVGTSHRVLLTTNN